MGKTEGFTDNADGLPQKTDQKPLDAVGVQINETSQSQVLGKTDSTDLPEIVDDAPPYSVRVVSAEEYSDIVSGRSHGNKEVVCTDDLSDDEAKHLWKEILAQKCSEIKVVKPDFFSSIGLSKASYDEIRYRLTEAGLIDLIHSDGKIDLTGVAVVIEE